MKNALKILCIILALCFLCSCSKLALGSTPDDPPEDMETTPPDNTEGEDSGDEEDIVPPDYSGDTPPEVVAFRTYTDYTDIFSVINGNADIAYGMYPDEAQQADGSATVVSANGLTEQKYTLSPSASDGKYIYTVSRGTLFVCDEDGIVSDTFLFVNDFETESGNNLSYGYENAESVYLAGETVIVVSSMFEYSSAGKETDKVNIYFCDVSNPEVPRVDRTVSQDGRFITAALCEDTLFAVSSHMISSAVESDITTYIPHIYAPGSAVPVASENIRVFEYSTCAGYTLVAGYGAEDGTLTGSAAALGGTGRIYVDNTDIYMAFFSEASEASRTYSEGNHDIEEFTNHCMTAVLKLPMVPQLSSCSEALIDGCFMGDFSIYSKDDNLYLCTIAERSTYAIYTDKTSGWSERRDVSAEIENILYTLSADLSNIAALVLPDDVVFSARFVENYAWVGYFSEELCFDLHGGAAVELPSLPTCCITYDEAQLLGISRKDAETLTFTMYRADDMSVVTETDLAIPTSFLNSASVAVHKESGLITLSAGAAGHCVISYDGESFSLDASVPTSGWVHCISTKDALYVIADKVTVLDIDDCSEISSFKLEAQSGAVG